MKRAGRGGSPPGSLGRQILYQKCNSIKCNKKGVGLERAMTW